MADRELHPAEAQAREEHAAGLEEQASVDGLDPEIARAIRDKANKIRNAMPVVDFKRAMQAYADSLDHGPDTGLEGLEYRAGVREAQAKLREDHPYPADLEHAVDAALLRGISPDDIDLYEVTGIPNPGTEKAGHAGPVSDREWIENAVAKAMAPLETRTYLVRRELDEFKASRGIK
jgi:hypothetical protein